MLPVAILAGGLASRLRPLTNSIPKSLIQIAGYPFIYWQLRYLRSQNIKKVVICTGYLSRLIEEVVGDGSQFDLEVIYSFDGSQLLGTGGAIQNAIPKLGSSFFILYGDTLLPIDFYSVQRAFECGGKLGLMTVLKNDNQWDKSNVVFENGSLIEYNKVNYKSKMKHIDYGLGILSAKVFETYSIDKPFDLAKVYQELSANQELFGHEVYNRFYEIGSISGIKETEVFLLSFQPKDFQ